MTQWTGKEPDTQANSRAAKLLHREVPSEYRAEWTAHAASEKKIVQAGTNSVIIFRIGKEWLALPTDMLQEVMDHYTIRTVPGRRGGIVKGLMNVRGELLLCIALDVVLGMEPVTPAQNDRLLIFARGGFAVRVSEVFGVYRYHETDLRLTPATLRVSSSGSFTLGILPWQGKSVACLDDALLLSAVNRGLS